MHVQLTRQGGPDTADLLHYIARAVEDLDPKQDAKVLATTDRTFQSMRPNSATHLSEVTEGQRLKTLCP